MNLDGKNVYTPWELLVVALSAEEGAQKIKEAVELPVLGTEKGGRERVKKSSIALRRTNVSRY